ncbi:MAG: hypothetical protein R6U44_03820 [Archaeoglobaceae archaeon]
MSGIIVQGDVKEAQYKFYEVLEKMNKEKEFKKIIYVTFNQPAKATMEKLSNTTLQDVYYVDMISKEEGLPQIPSAVYLDSPDSFNDLIELLVSELSDDVLLVLDNIHSIFLFEEENRVQTFLKTLFNIVSGDKSYLVTYLVKGSLEGRLETSALGYGDEIIETQRFGSLWEEWKRMNTKDVFSLKSPILFFIYINQLVVISFLIIMLLFI